MLDAGQNPLESDFIEFVSMEDLDNDIRQISRIEFREAGDGEEYGALWLVLLTFENGIQDGDPVEARMIRMSKTQPSLSNTASARGSRTQRSICSSARTTISMLSVSKAGTRTTRSPSASSVRRLRAASNASW